MLLNFRTRRVGLNQLSSTFYPTFEVVGDDALDVIPNKLHLIKKNKRTISIKKINYYGRASTNRAHVIIKRLDK